MRAVASTLPQLLRGALAGRYALERELGRSGMATVYLAEDVRHRRKVAVVSNDGSHETADVSRSSHLALAVSTRP